MGLICKDCQKNYVHHRNKQLCRFCAKKVLEEKPRRKKKKKDHEDYWTEERLNRLIEQQRKNLPDWWEHDYYCCHDEKWKDVKIEKCPLCFIGENI